MRCVARNAALARANVDEKPFVRGGTNPKTKTQKLTFRKLDRAETREFRPMEAPFKRRGKHANRRVLALASPGTNSISPAAYQLSDPYGCSRQKRKNKIKKGQKLKD